MQKPKMFHLSSLPKSGVVQCGVAAVISVLFISWLRIRPLGLFFLATLCFWCYKTLCNLRILPPSELQKKITHLTEKFQDIRQNKPTMFCLISAGCLSAMAIIGHVLSDSTVVLTGLVLAAVFSAKYNFKIIKIEQKDFVWMDKIHHEIEFDDEFLPEVNEKNRVVLDRAGDLASLSSPTEEITNGEDDEEKSDEIPSELLLPDPIPEVNEHYTDDELIEDLVPITTNAKGEAIEDVKSKCQNPESEGIEFKRRHFKSDSSLSHSSSSSEESISKGLQFPDHTTIDGPTLQNPYNQVAGAAVALAVKTQFANSNKVMPSLMSGLVQWGMSSSVGAGAGSSHAAINATAESNVKRHMVTALDSSDESDFEIITKDDFK